MTKNCPRNALRILASPDLFLPLIPVPWGRDILPSLRPHRATRDERAGAQGRVVRGSPRTRRTERIVRAFPGPGSGAGGHHDRCPSRSGWADRRPNPSRAAPRQHSRQPPLPSDRPSSRIAAARRRASLFADYPRRGHASPLQLSIGSQGRRSLTSPEGRRALSLARATAPETALATNPAHARFLLFSIRRLR